MEPKSGRYRITRANAIAAGLCLAAATLSAQTINLDDIANGIGGFSLPGIAHIDFAGTRVSTAGDVNGDGLTDVLVAATGARSGVGEVYVVFGTSKEPVPTLSGASMGIGGFLISPSTGDYGLGSGASDAGDVNGDGLDDVIIGSPYTAIDGLPSAGRAWVVFGKVDSAPVSLDDVLLGVGGFVIDGYTALDHAGDEVDRAGDVNGDGLDDLIVSAPTADRNGNENCGEAWVVFGKSDTLPVDLADVSAGIGGFVVTGLDFADRVGYSISGAGRVNDDEFDDVIIGARLRNVDGMPDAGEAYVIFGNASGGIVDLVDVINGVGGFAIRGAAPLDQVGYSVAGLGDLNDDGLDDVLVGAGGADPDGIEDAGAAYVVFGRTITTPISTSDLATGVGGYAINGFVEGARAGRAVAAINDVDGDGINDMLVDNGLFVVYGKTHTSSMNLADVADGTGGFQILATPWPAYSVSGAGDFNGDGFGDIVLGNNLFDLTGTGPGTGAAFVVFSPYGETQLRSSGGGSNRCFIATAAYGSPMAGELDVLRDLRDQRLLTNPLGATFADAYYHLSPPLADTLARNDTLRRISRTTLAPIVAFSRWLTESDDPKSN